MTLFQVDAPHFCAGVEVNEGVVTAAAPIMRWAVGKPWRRVREYAQLKGWRWQVCTTP